MVLLSKVYSLPCSLLQPLRSTMASRYFLMGGNYRMLVWWYIAQRFFRLNFSILLSFFLSQITVFFLPVGFSHEIVEYFMKLKGKLYLFKAKFLHSSGSILKSKPAILNKFFWILFCFLTSISIGMWHLFPIFQKAVPWVRESKGKKF